MLGKKYLYFITYSVKNEDSTIVKSGVYKLKYLIENKETIDLVKVEIASHLTIGNKAIRKILPIDNISIINFQYYEPNIPIEHSETERYLYNVVIDCSKVFSENDFKSTYVKTDYNVSNFEELRALKQAAFNNIEKEYDLTLDKKYCNILNYCFISQISADDEDEEDDE